MKTALITGIKLVKASSVLLTIIIAGLIFGMFSEGFDRLWTPFIINSVVFPEIWNLKAVVWFGILAMTANAVGQIVGGPLLGFIATVVSLRLSLVLAGLFLIPSLFLYTNSIKKHKLVEPGIGYNKS